MGNIRGNKMNIMKKEVKLESKNCSDGNSWKHCDVWCTNYLYKTDSSEGKIVKKLKHSEIISASHNPYATISTAASARPIATSYSLPRHSRGLTRINFEIPRCRGFPEETSEMGTACFHLNVMLNPIIRCIREANCEMLSEVLSEIFEHLVNELLFTIRDSEMSTFRDESINSEMKRVARGRDNQDNRIDLITKSSGVSRNCQVVNLVVREYGRINDLVNNADEQHMRNSIEEITKQQLEGLQDQHLFTLFFGQACFEAHERRELHHQLNSSQRPLWESSAELHCHKGSNRCGFN
ncbi:hypothetical protein SESBI_43067 [Sesbania bispinosa]|nr:hypothetical protein SESBI_43067 [Sesbania bispinosa]